MKRVLGNFFLGVSFQIGKKKTRTLRGKIKEERSSEMKRRGQKGFPESKRRRRTSYHPRGNCHKRAVMVGGKRLEKKRTKGWGKNQRRGREKGFGKGEKLWVLRNILVDFSSEKAEPCLMQENQDG